MKTLIITYIFILSINVFADSCLSDLSLFYDDSGTCNEVKMQLGTNDIVTNKREERIKRLKEEMGILLVRKGKSLTESLGSIDHLFQLTSSQNKLDGVPECSLSRMTSVSCSDSNYFKEVFAQISGDISSASTLSGGFTNSFSNNALVNISSSTDGMSCMNKALLREIAWNSDNKQNDLKSETKGKDFIESLNRLKDNDGTDVVGVDYTFITNYYPNFFEDVKNGRLIVPESYTDGNLEKQISDILSSNKEKIKANIKQSCIDFNEMMEEGLCKKIEGSQISDPQMSMSWFNFVLRGHNGGFDASIADENFEDIENSFQHFSASCFGKGCEDDSCLDMDNFLDKYFPNGAALMQTNINENTGELVLNDDIVNMEQCKQLNCTNHEAMITDGSITCAQRETQNIPALRTEFSCETNPDSGLCQTLVIIERSRQRPLSTFAKTILGQEVSQAITVSAASTDSIAIDTGIDEEASSNLETPYDRGERTYENSRSMTAPATTSGGASGRRSSAAAKNSSKQAAQTKNYNTPERYRDTVSPTLDNSPISTDPVAETSEEGEYTEEETSLIGNLRDAISSTISDIGDAAKRAVSPRAPAQVPKASGVTSRLGETTTEGSNNGASTDDTFSNDFRESIAAVQPGDAPEGFDGMQESAIVSSGGAATAGRGLASSSGTGRSVASAGAGAENTGYISVGSDLLQSITLTAGELEVLDEARIRELNIPMTEPFVIMVKIDGRDVPVKVRQIAQGDSFVLRPLIDETNQEVEDELRKAPVFASYFNSPVMRVRSLDNILDGQ